MKNSNIHNKFQDYPYFMEDIKRNSPMLKTQQYEDLIFDLCPT